MHLAADIGEMVSLHERVTKSGHSVGSNAEAPGVQRWQRRYKDLCYAWLKKAFVRNPQSNDQAYLRSARTTYPRSLAKNQKQVMENGNIF